MQLVFAILNSLGLVGLGAFLWFIWRGLRDRIHTLQELAGEQTRTLTVVRERADEFDRLSQRYKKALSDFDEMGAKTEARRLQLVRELEEANKRKDAEIIALKEGELKKVEKEQESLEKISEITAQIEKLREEVRKHAAAITELDPLSEFRTLASGRPLDFLELVGPANEAEAEARLLSGVASSIYPPDKRRPEASTVRQDDKK